MKVALFYCENCRKTVPLEAELCPHCGRRFTAVQCPQCSYVGKAYLFSDGCPQCGYLGPAAGRRGAGEAQAIGGIPTPSPAPLRPKGGGRGRAAAGQTLPSWFYALASVLLVLVLVALVFVLLRMR